MVRDLLIVFGIILALTFFENTATFIVEGGGNALFCSIVSAVGLICCITSWFSNIEGCYYFPKEMGCFHEDYW